MIREAFLRRLRFRALHLLIVAAAPALTLNTHAQSAESASQPEGLPVPQFEVAAIKPQSRGASMNGGWRFTADSFTATNLTLKTLIFLAYNLRASEQLQGLPGWGHTDEWDIEAKISGEDVQKLRKLDQQHRADENRLMVRDLLATRFGLSVHRETRKLPIYELVIAKNGFQPKPPTANEKGSGWSSGNGLFEGKDVGVDALTYSLSSSDDVGRIVLNKTGLKGKYDIALKWTPDNEQQKADSGPSIFTALKEQLGLKLVSAKGPVDTIIVDRVKLPSAN